MKTITFIFFFITLNLTVMSQENRARDHGIQIGVLSPGVNNAITDVKGVKVGHFTLIETSHIRTGVTSIIPHDKNIFKYKVPAGLHIGNGYGKLMGISQIQELGNLETPIILTNTLSVPTAANALISYTLERDTLNEIRSVNPIVGETNDGRLNDIRGRHIREEHVLKAIQEATSGKVSEGNIGAGTGTVCFGYKGGIGTSSRVLPKSLGGYTIGVLVQSNFGGVLEINGAPIGRELDKFIYKKDIVESADGSCMIIVATDAPLDSRNLNRLAKRAMMGLAKTGGIASNGSGDYVIAFSTHSGNINNLANGMDIYTYESLQNQQMSPLFLAVIEATEEAIINSLFAAETMKGNGREIKELPLDETLEILKKYNKLKGEK